MSAKRQREASSSQSSTSSSQSDDASAIVHRTPLALKRAKPFVPPQRITPAQSASKQPSRLAPASTPIRSSRKSDVRTPAADSESQIRDILKSSCCCLFTPSKIKARLAEIGTKLSDEEVQSLLSKITLDHTAFGSLLLPADIQCTDSLISIQPLVPCLADIPSAKTIVPSSTPAPSQNSESVTTNALVTPRKTNRTSSSPPAATPVSMQTPKTTNHLSGGMSSELRARLASRRGPNLLAKSTRAQPQSTVKPTVNRSSPLFPLSTSSSPPSNKKQSPSDMSIAELQAELDAVNRSVAKLQNERVLNVDTNETTRLNVLADKWLKACQSALVDLLDGINQHRGDVPLDMPTLFRMMQLDHEQLQYSMEAEEFLDSQPKT